MTTHIWVWIQHGQGDIESDSLGLIHEAARLIAKDPDSGTITALVFGAELEPVLDELENYGIHRILYSSEERFHAYQGESFAQTLNTLAQDENPSFIFFAQNARTADLAPRLAALMESAMVSHAMDLTITPDHQAVAVRPRSNGYLFQHLFLDRHHPPLICFNPSVLSSPEPDKSFKTKRVHYLPGPDTDALKTRLIEVVEATAQDLDLEEADIIVAGGRGAGDAEQFRLIHDLAGLLGGPVGGTRPVIDEGILPYERQIGQTGKLVKPRLLINCGISGANEYTAGIEKSKMMISLNTDERARIFNFSDLGLVGDLTLILPIAIDRIRQLKKP